MSGGTWRRHRQEQCGQCEYPGRARPSRCVREFCRRDGHGHGFHRQRRGFDRHQRNLLHRPQREQHHRRHAGRYLPLRKHSAARRYRHVLNNFAGTVTAKHFAGDGLNSGKRHRQHRRPSRSCGGEQHLHRHGLRQCLYRQQHRSHRDQRRVPHRPQRGQHHRRHARRCAALDECAAPRPGAIASPAPSTPACSPAAALR